MRRHVESSIDDARGSLVGEAFAAAWTTGSGLTERQTIALALAEFGHGDPSRSMSA
ncbi:MAG: hypothetical protein ACRDLK_02120 [Gaiellaceae bacterium]